MKVYLFLLCYNERAILQQTVEYYRRALSNAEVVMTIYDNLSTDGSFQLAQSLGCNVIRFSSGNEQNEPFLRRIKNEAWKNVPEDAWVIVCDMDELLVVSTEDLVREREAGVHILTTQGYEMIGKSERLDLSDIDLHEVCLGYENPAESKRICFWRGAVKEIGYEAGAHVCHPVPREEGASIVYSEKVYSLKHMNKMGLPYYTDKMLKRFARTHRARRSGLSIHYTNNISEIVKRYDDDLKRSHEINF